MDDDDAARDSEQIEQLEELRELNAASLLAELRSIVRPSSDQRKQLKIEQLTHEMAMLKRWRLARSEQLHGVQRSLLDESDRCGSRGDRPSSRRCSADPPAKSKEHPRRSAAAAASRVEDPPRTGRHRVRLRLLLSNASART